MAHDIALYYAVFSITYRYAKPGNAEDCPTFRCKRTRPIRIRGDTDPSQPGSDPFGTVRYGSHSERFGTVRNGSKLVRIGTVRNMVGKVGKNLFCFNPAVLYYIVFRFIVSFIKLYFSWSIVLILDDYYYSSRSCCCC